VKKLELDAILVSAFDSDFFRGQKRVEKGIFGQKWAKLGYRMAMVFQ
jgi:hypothetical protein